MKTFLYQTSKQHTTKLLFCCITIIVLGIITYCLNTFLIKPKINEKNSFFSYFICNFLNDIWAGSIIAAFANILVLFRNSYFKSIVFYFIIWIIESVIWEFLRPAILSVFNPFNKVPKLLFGDFISYALGTLIVFMLLRLLSKKHEF